MNPSQGRPATNWAGNISYCGRPIHQPTSIDELRQVVHDASRIRPVGNCHSFSPIIECGDELVQIDRLPPEVEIDAARGTAIVAAGMRYSDLVTELRRAGLALANLPSLPYVSVAGACATGTHGSGDMQRSLAADAIGLRVVGPEGDIVEMSRGPEGDTFPGWVVALGALGVVTHATLRVEPAFDVAQTVYVAVTLDDVVDRFDEVFGAAYSVSLFTDWRSNSANVWLKRRTDTPEATWRGGRPADHPVHPVPGWPANLCTEQLGIPGPWHERLPHFRAEPVNGAADELQSEFFVPRASASAALDAVRRIGERVAAVLHVSEVRTVKGDDLWLSPAYGRDSVTLHFTWTNDLAAVRPVITAIEEELAPFDARPHWAKLTTMTPAEVIALYERASDFRKLVVMRDPEGKFRNAYLDALLMLD